MTVLRLDAAPAAPANGLTHRARRLGIDTGQEAVVYLRRDSAVVRSEGFDSQTRIEVHAGSRTIRATLGVVTGSLLGQDEAGLSEAAWARLRAAVRLLHGADFARPVIVAVHAVMAEGAAEHFDQTGGVELATCNTIDHPSNRIDVSGAIRRGVAHQFQVDARQVLAPSGER